MGLAAAARRGHTIGDAAARLNYVAGNWRGAAAAVA